jgi:TetR/AcrR family transcriptional repressor of nem operon
MAAGSKEKLLDVALHVIRAKGYAATSVDDLCSAAGLTKGSFFHHFESKEALAVAATQYFSEMADALFASAPYRKIEDPLERVLGYLDFRASLMKGDLPDFTCLLGTLVQENYQTSPALRRACDQHISHHAKQLVADLAQAASIYAPRADWKPEALAFYIQAVIQGSFILAKAKNGPAIARDCLSQLRSHVEAQFLRSTPNPTAKRKRHAKHH